jgi:hypothetical protein
LNNQETNLLMRNTKVPQEGSTAFHMNGISAHGMGSTLEFISESEVFSALHCREVKKSSVQYITLFKTYPTLSFPGKPSYGRLANLITVVVVGAKTFMSMRDFLRPRQARLSLLGS